MAFVRNIVIVVVAIAFWNRFFRQRTTNDKEKLLQSYDYIIGKYLLSMSYLDITGLFDSDTSQHWAS